MQQNPSERLWCKFNTTIDMCLYVHNRMIMNYGCKHIIINSYIIYIEKAKYKKSMCCMFAYKINELRYFEGQNSEF